MSDIEKTEDVEETGARILVVDDEDGVRNYLAVVLQKAGFDVDVACDGLVAHEMLCNADYDVVLEDLKMPNLDGLGLLRRIKDGFPHLAVVVMTAFSSWESAVEAMRLGAFNYIRKPFDNDEIRSIIKHASEAARSNGLSEDADDPFAFRQIIGNSPGIRHVQDIIKRVAPTDSTVCIQGDSGTGKELVARALHYQSSRRHGRFIAVNCAAFTDSLLESELFGHVKGAFTSAVRDKQGLFEIAQGGTFFLDEVADMSKQLQTKLLRTLEEREIKPVGSTETIPIDVRLVAASNKNMEEEIGKGNFREDLFYRLNVIPLTLPPLKERKGDIPFLVGHFLGKYADGMKKKVTSISREALDVLFAHDWPGNIRELENVIQRAVAFCNGREIRPCDLSEQVAFKSGGTKGSDDEKLGSIPAGGLKLEDRLDEIEKAYITEALRRCDNVVTRAADLLHMNVRALRYRIKKLDLRSAVQTSFEEDR